MGKKDLLVVVDMQNDFISGELGSRRAREIVERVEEKIDSWDGLVVATMDTHYENYKSTAEGKSIPSHCIYGTDGWKMDERIMGSLARKSDIPTIFRKGAFGCHEIGSYVSAHGCESVQFIGLCTDICVLSSAVMLRSMNQYIDISVDASCCAGTNERAHRAALEVMRSCCIRILDIPKEKAD